MSSANNGKSGIQRMAPRGAGIGGPKKGSGTGGPARNPRKNAVAPIKIGIGNDDVYNSYNFEKSIVEENVSYEALKAAALIKYGAIGGYRVEYCDIAAKFGEMGRSKNELARFLVVSAKTLRRWAAEHEEFGLAIDYLETARTASLEKAMRIMIETGNISNERVRALEFLLRSAAPEYRLPNMNIAAGAEAGSDGARAAIQIVLSEDDNSL